VTAMLPITHGERAAWQRRAALTLVEILDVHKDLPVIVWAVANAGSTLVGRISTLAPVVEATTVFDAWRQALALGERIETPGGAGRVFLRASGARGAVRVAITATVVDHDGEGWR
jgi:hypothetical protein